MFVFLDDDSRLRRCVWTGLRQLCRHLDQYGTKPGRLRRGTTVGAVHRPHFKLCSVKPSGKWRPSALTSDSYTTPIDGWMSYVETCGH
jgi:hypothetical protein